MCRMIAAVGRESSAVRQALVRMAANDNPAHDHEYRSRGAAFRHTDGWGMAWAQDGRLRTVRRTISVLLDGWVERIDSLQTHVLLLHARKATQPGSVNTGNTHPFPATLLGRDWAFCHNGAVEDLDGLRPTPGKALGGGTDSERLFHHFLAELAERTEVAARTEVAPVEEAAAPTEVAPVEEAAARTDVAVRVEEAARTDAEGAVTAGPVSGARGLLPGLDWTLAEAALAATIAVPEDFTALHCLAASTDRVLAAACRHPTKSQPEYHALWLGEGPGMQVVSSEPVDGLGCAWTRLSEPGVVTLKMI